MSGSIFFTAAHLQLLSDVTNSFNQLSIIIRLPLCIVFESKIFSNRYFCFFCFDKKKSSTILSHYKWKVILATLCPFVNFPRTFSWILMKTICNSAAGAAAARSRCLQFATVLSVVQLKKNKGKTTLGRWATNVFSVKPTNDVQGMNKLLVGRQNMVEQQKLHLKLLSSIGACSWTSSYNSVCSDPTELMARAIIKSNTKVFQKYFFKTNVQMYFIYSNGPWPGEEDIVISSQVLSSRSQLNFTGRRFPSETSLLEILENYVLATKKLIYGKTKWDER